jgi:hypothetical protein
MEGRSTMGLSAEITPIDDGQRLVIVFTITGKVYPEQAAKWNEKMRELRELGIKVQTVTIRAEPLPPAGESAR